MRSSRDGQDLVFVGACREQNACCGGRALHFGNDEIGRAGQCIAGVDVGAAAVGEQELSGCAAGFGDAVGIGEGEKAAGA